MDAMDAAAYGSACKALKRGVIAGHLVVFGSPSIHDRTRYRDFFTSRTAYELDACGYKSRTLYDHGLDPVLKKRRLTLGTMNPVDLGVWIEAQLALRDEYEAALYHLAQTNKLNWSSGTAGHLTERKAIELRDGTIVHEVLAWPLGLDASLTTRPADPRGIVSVKSLGFEPTVEEWLEHPAVKAAVDAIRRDAGAPLTAYSFGAELGTYAGARSVEHTTIPDARSFHASSPRNAVERVAHDGAALRNGSSDHGAETKRANSGVVPVRSFTWLQRLVQGTDVPVLVDFAAYDDIRGGTQAERRGLLEDVATGYGENLLIVSVDMARSADVGAAFGIYDAATLLFRNGGLIERADGPYSLGMMLATLERVVGVPRSLRRRAVEEAPADTNGRMEMKASPPCLATVLPEKYPGVTWHEWALEPQWGGNEADAGALVETPKATDYGVEPGHNPEEPADLLPADWEVLMKEGAVIRPAGSAETFEGEPLEETTPHGTVYGFPYEEFFYYLRRLYWCARARHYRGQRAPPDG